MESNIYRGWEYAKLGDYHKNLDPNWSYTPTYLKKMAYVKNFLDSLEMSAKILDAGCGEGVLVEEYLKREYLIEGLDLNYESKFVKRGDITRMPYEEELFDVVLLLDVFEHLSFVDQPRALQEIRRVLKHRGIFLISVPNLAHLNSRFNFFFRGKLDRTDIEINHISERPIEENKKLLIDNGFEILKEKGITLTIPYIYRNLICKEPKKYRWLHDLFNFFAYPNLAMLNIFLCRRLHK